MVKACIHTASFIHTSSDVLKEHSCEWLQKPSWQRLFHSLHPSQYVLGAAQGEITKTKWMIFCVPLASFTPSSPVPLTSEMLPDQGQHEHPGRKLYELEEVLKVPPKRVNCKVWYLHQRQPSLKSHLSPLFMV